MLRFPRSNNRNFGKQLQSMMLENVRVFIVEDNDANLQIMELALQSVGAEVEIYDWEIPPSVHLKNIKPIDVILLDLMLTRKSVGDDITTGYTVFQNIRKMPQFDDIPIIAVSALDRETAVPTLRENGFTGFIAKPIQLEYFAHQIASIIEGEALWDGQYF